LRRRGMMMLDELEMKTNTTTGDITRCWMWRKERSEELNPRF